MCDKNKSNGLLKSLYQIMSCCERLDDTDLRVLEIVFKQLLDNRFKKERTVEISIGVRKSVKQVTFNLVVRLLSDEAHVRWRRMDNTEQDDYLACAQAHGVDVMLRAIEKRIGPNDAERILSSRDREGVE